MGIEGQESPRDVASENKRHPWEVFPGDETSAEDKGRKERKENKEDNKFIKWVKTHKLLFVGIVLATIAIIIGGILGFNALKKNGVFGGQTSSEEDNSQGIGISYEEYLKLLSLDTPYAENAFDYAIGILKPILFEGVSTSSETGIDYTKMEDNFEIFLKKVEKPDDKICYRLAMIYTMYRSGERAADRAKNLLELFDEENHELNKTQRFFYLMVQTEKAAAAGDSDEVARLITQIDEEYPPDEGYVDIDTGETITDPEKLKEIKEAFDKYSKEDE